MSAISQALAGENAHDVQNILEHEIPENEDVFETLNKSSFRDGAFIKGQRAAVSDLTFHIINCSGSEDSSVNFGRHMIYLEEGACANVIESCVSLNGKAKVINNVMTDIVLQERSNLTYSRLQEENDLSSIYLLCVHD